MATPGFFERQANARRNTGLLVVLFLTAVALITLSVCLVGYLVTRGEQSYLPFHHWLLSSHGLITAGAVVVLVGAGSLIRWADLAGGGTRVAKMVGARPIDPDTRDPEERRLRNIVEEMSIASGVPVPELYVMEQEAGINAFVAGYTTGEAVMVVTHGALTQLDRDELQGVVAHEFSHILNGDMRINVRLIAVLAGILMIGQVGQFLIRAGFYSSGRSRRDGRAQAAMGLLGLALVIIGYIGVFFGRLIQAAVSRQRESLADASSVQFTRNPEGIGGALFKIGVKGGYLDTTSHASDMNHMCFGESARMKFSSLLASHPPIEDRIDAIQPGLMTRLRSRLRDALPSDRLQTGQDAPAGNLSGLTTGLANAEPVDSSAHPAPGPAPAEPHPAPATRPGTPLSAKVGTISSQSEAFAIRWLNQLPATFRNLLYTRTGAVQFCYALTVCGLSRETREQRMALIAPHPLLGPQPALQEKLIPALEALGEGARFPSLELAMPALRKLDPEERTLLIANVRALVSADKRISLFEFALTSFLERHLGLGAEQAPPVRYRTYQAILPALRPLMSLFSRAGTGSAEEARALYQEAMAGFEQAPDSAPGEVTLRDLHKALAMLNRLSPLLKPAVIDACAHCVTHDGRIDAREYELMRLVADQLDSPMPPL